MPEISELSRTLFGDEPSTGVAPVPGGEPAGPSPGWSLRLEPVAPPEDTDLAERLFPPEPQARVKVPEEYNLRGPLSGLPWYVKTPLAMGTSAVGGALGTAGGAAVGSMVPFVGTAAGGTAGYLGGNAAARWLNVKLGLEEPGMLGDFLSVALPAGMKGGGALLKQGVRRAPGAAVVRHEMAEDMLTGPKGLGARLKPTVASDDLFTQAAAHNPNISAISIWQYADELLKREQVLQADWPKLANDTIATLAQEGKDMVVKYGGQVPLHLMDEFRKRVGEQMTEAASNKWVQESGLRKLYAGLFTDMERSAAAGIPGAAVLKQAIKAHRTEKALDELSDLWSPGKGIQAVEGDVVQVMGKRIQSGFDRLLKADPRFAGSFTLAELADINKTLEVVAKYAPGGSPLSHGRFANATHVAALAAGGVAAWSKQDPILGVGVAAGIEALPAIIATLMTSQGGRAAIRMAMKDSGGRLTESVVAGLAASARAFLASREPEQPQPGISGYPWGESQQAPGGPERRTD